MHIRYSFLFLMFSLIFYGCQPDKGRIQAVEEIKIDRSELQQIGEHIYKDPTTDSYKEDYFDEYPLPHSNIKNSTPSLLEAKRILTELTPVYLHMSHIEIVDLNSDDQPEIIGQFKHEDPFENGYERFYIARYEKNRWIRDASYHYSEVENCESDYQYQLGKIDGNGNGVVLTCNGLNKYVITLFENKVTLWKHVSVP